MNPMEKLLHFLAQLKEKKIYFTLEHNSEVTIMVKIAVPGERWEVEFFGDGDVQIEIFRSDGKILREAELDRLFRQFSD